MKLLQMEKPDVHLIVPPDDAIRAIFTPEVLQKLRATRNPSPFLCRRLEILTACGPYPSDVHAADWLMHLRAQKAAWEAYIYCGFVCGLFEGPEGNDVRQRLTGTDDDGFRSAMAECMACWFLGGKMGFKVSSKPKGRGNKVADLLVTLPDGDCLVEVKAPHREKLPLVNAVWWGHDGDALEECMNQANKQFPEGTANILFLVPTLKISVYAMRIQLINAFYGQEMIKVPIDITKGGPAGPTRLEFAPDGMFLNPIKSGRTPAYTRISAVICAEENVVQYEPFPTRRDLTKKELDQKLHKYFDGLTEIEPCRDNPYRIEPNVLVAHNPFAKQPISTEIWSDFPQFVPDNGVMRWTDGKGIHS